jgi:phage shock protein C
MQPVSDPRFHRGADRILGGVCSGLGEGFRIDPLWIRIAFVLLAFVQGIGIFLYLILWLVMPERLEGQPASRSGFDSMTADIRRLWSELGGHPSGQAPPPIATSTEPGVAPAQPSAVPVSAGRRNQPVLLGIALVVIGVLALGNNMGLFNWDVVWPVALIAVGVVLVLRSAQRRA